MNVLRRFNKSDYIKATVILLWGICCFLFFQISYKYHFFYEEQNQLFLLSDDYLQTYFQKPAWLACMVGDFLTQFYYYLYAGPGILTLILLTLGDFTRRSLERSLSGLGFQKVVGWVAFVLAIVLMTVEARLSLYEGYKLSRIIALLGGVGLWLVFDLLPWSRNRYVRLVDIVLIPLTWWMFGYGVFAFIIFEAISLEVKALRNFMAREQIVFSNIHSLVFLAVVLLFCVFSGSFASCFYLNGKDALLYPGVGKWVNYDDEMTVERGLTLDNEYYFGHYQQVLQLYNETKGEKTDYMKFYYCLALAQLDMLPDRLMDIDKPVLGTFYNISSDSPLYVIKMIDDLYYLIGDMTYTERAALLANTFTPGGRNVRMIKRLAEVNLVNGDKVAAMKYLRLLDKTFVYHQWAKEHTPETMSSEVMAEISKKQKFLNKEDNIRIGDDCYTILTQLLDSNKENTVALDYLLCSDIVARQKDMFMRDYQKYGPRQKTLYQQALSMQ